MFYSNFFLVCFSKCSVKNARIFPPITDSVLEADWLALPLNLDTIVCIQALQVWLYAAVAIVFLC
jgi:hypothetical protein